MGLSCPFANYSLPDKLRGVAARAEVGGGGEASMGAKHNLRATIEVA